MTYSLDIEIDAADVPILREAGQSVVVARPWPEAGILVAWVVTAPASEQQVSWDDTRSIYASATRPAVGARVVMQATASAVPGVTYRYLDGFTPATAQPPVAGVRIWNDVPPSQARAMTFGYAQAFSLNGNPFGAVVPAGVSIVPAQQYEELVAVDSVLVFVQSGVSSGGNVLAWPLSDAGRSTSQALRVDFDPTHPQRTVRYDGGRFILV